MTTGQQVFAYNKANLVSQAAISADIAASQKTPLVYPVSKQGTGGILVSGNYTGALDALYELVVSDIAFTSPIVSSPLFRGAGSGKIKDVAVSGLDAQQITILLQSTGIATQQATAEIEGVTFRAKPVGAPGNAITITIDNSGLLYTPTNYSTIEDLDVGDTALEGQQWDFDTKTILGNIIPTDAHRIRFGEDKLNVYRQYKRFENNIYKYYFIVPIRYFVPAGTRIYFVTGGRTVTVSNGTITEEYENIVTVADLWAAVRDTSALIEPVDSSINTSNTPDSLSVRELAVMTSAYALPSYAGEGSTSYAGRVTGVGVTASTKTELISAECIDNTFLGEELWKVKGSSSGDLGTVKTGEFTGLGPIGFTIPKAFPPDWETSIKEDWSFKPEYANRDDESDPPPICLAFKQGSKSIPQTLRLVYTKKPVSCACPVVSFEDKYLGYEQEGGENTGMAYTIPDLKFWLQALQIRMGEQFSSIESSESTADPLLAPGVFDTAIKRYMDFFRTLGERMANLPEESEEQTNALTPMLAKFKALAKTIYLRIPSGYASRTFWSPQTNALNINIVIPTSPNGFYYSRQSAASASFIGESGAAEPVWPLTIGQSVADNNLLWRLEAIRQLWAAEAFVITGEYRVPTTHNGYLYQAIQNGDTDITEPEWPTTIGALVNDGATVWRCYAELDEWEPETEYAYGKTICPTQGEFSGYIFSVIQVVLGGSGNMTGTTEPVWPTTLGDTIVDGDVTWVCRGTTPLWAADTDVTAGQLYQPSTPNGYLYLCIESGTTDDADEPVWATSDKAVITDGTVKWECIGLFPSQLTYIWNDSYWRKGYTEPDEHWTPNTVAVSSCDIVFDTKMYGNLVDDILAFETAYGLKKNSSPLRGDVPYQQPDDEFYWKFTEGAKQYLPAYTGVPYYSIINSCGCGDEYIGTKEFGLNISVPCGGNLVEGDAIVIEIGGNSTRTYQLGDITFIPTVAAAPLAFAGGIDGDDTYKWEVRGNALFPDYLLDRDDPQPYRGTNALAWQAGHSYLLSDYVKAGTFNGYRYECTTAGPSGLTEPTWPTTPGTTVSDGDAVWTCRAVELVFEITDGIVGFSVGDNFTFSIEGGHWKWRKNSGAWSSAIPISVSPQLMEEGIFIAFDFGAAPSFVTNDLWEIICVQENKAENLTLPLNHATKGTGSIVFTFSEAQTVEQLIIDRHTLSGTVKLQASDDENFAELLHDESLVLTSLICNIYEGAAAITAKYFRLLITGGFEIGYVYLGPLVRLSVDADSIIPSRKYNLERQDGNTPFSLYKYNNRGFSLQYNSFLKQADYELLDDIFSYLKTNNDLPFYFLPNINYPSDCMRCRINTDNQDPGSDIDYNMPPERRVYSLSLPLISY